MIPLSTPPSPTGKKFRDDRQICFLSSRHSPPLLDYQPANRLPHGFALASESQPADVPVCRGIRTSFTLTKSQAILRPASLAPDSVQAAGDFANQATRRHTNRSLTYPSGCSTSTLEVDSHRFPLVGQVKCSARRTRRWSKCRSTAEAVRRADSSAQG